MKKKNAFSKQIGGDHYKHLVIEPAEFCHANQIPYIEGCVIKYVLRWRQKGKLEDIKKAKHYLDLLIESENKYQTLKKSL